MNKYFCPHKKNTLYNYLILKLYNCELLEHRPFCDGTHRSEEIQGAKADIRTELWEPKEW